MYFNETASEFCGPDGTRTRLVNTVDEMTGRFHKIIQTKQMIEQCSQGNESVFAMTVP